MGDLELHAAQGILEVGGGIADLAPVLTLGDSLLGLVVVAHEGLHHVFGLPQRAELIVVTVSVLLQEVVLNHAGHVQRNLIRVTQSSFTDQLDDLIEFLGLGQQLT